MVVHTRLLRPDVQRNSQLTASSGPWPERYRRSVSGAETPSVCARISGNALNASRQAPTRETNLANGDITASRRRRIAGGREPGLLLTGDPRDRVCERGVERLEVVGEAVV